VFGYYKQFKKIVKNRSNLKSPWTFAHCTLNLRWIHLNPTFKGPWIYHTLKLLEPMLKDPLNLCWKPLEPLLKAPRTYAEGPLKPMLKTLEPMLKTLEPMLKDPWTFAEGSLNLCWRILKPMLKDLWTYAEGSLNLCWRTLEPMLKDP
jgi:hypothetical protein